MSTPQRSKPQQQDLPDPTALAAWLPLADVSAGTEDSDGRFLSADFRTGSFDILHRPDGSVFGSSWLLGSNTLEWLDLRPAQVVYELTWHQAASAVLDVQQEVQGRCLGAPVSDERAESAEACLQEIDTVLHGLRALRDEIASPAAYETLVQQLGLPRPPAITDAMPMERCVQLVVMAACEWAVRLIRTARADAGAVDLALVAAAGGRSVPTAAKRCTWTFGSDTIELEVRDDGLVHGHVVLRERPGHRTAFAADLELTAWLVWCLAGRERAEGDVRDTLDPLTWRLVSRPWGFPLGSARRHLTTLRQLVARGDAYARKRVESAPL
jgi:hypothetical protein